MNISLIKSTSSIACKLFILCSYLNNPEWPTEGTKRVTCTSMYLIAKIYICRVLAKTKYSSFLCFMFYVAQQVHFKSVDSTKLFSLLNGPFFHFFAIKLGCFIELAWFSHVTKWESLVAKIEKQDKTKFGRIESWSSLKFLQMWFILLL